MNEDLASHVEQGNGESYSFAHNQHDQEQDNLDGEVSKSYFRVLNRIKLFFYTAGIFKHIKSTHTFSVRLQDQNVKPLPASSGDKLFSKLYFWGIPFS